MFWRLMFHVLIIFSPCKLTGGNFRYDCGTIFVKGYDSSLGENDLARALLEHFSPCGMISRIYFQTNDAGEAVLKSVTTFLLQFCDK